MINNASISNYNFDSCLIVFNEIINDARALNLARTLVKLNYKVCIIAYSNLENEKLLEKENIILFHINKSNHKKVWQKWLDFRKKAFLIKNKIKSKTYLAADVYSLPIAIKFKNIFKSKMIYDSREIYSSLGPLHKNPYKQKILSYLERRWIVNVDLILVSGEFDKIHLTQLFNSISPIEIIKNFPPYQDKFKNDYLRINYKISKDKIILIYQGMILKGRGLEKLILSMKFIDNVCFCLVGDGNELNNLKLIVDKENLNDKVIFCGKFDYDKLYEITCSAEIGISFIEPISFSYQLALPNKLFEYCMARIPTLTSDLPAMKAVIDEFNIGEYINYNSTPKDLALKLNEMVSNKKNYFENCDKAAHVLCFEIHLDKISKIMKDLCI